ncbi:MAG TPA: hypothetical protein VIJ65_01115 [Acidobacteriaceae bacterium]
MANKTPVNKTAEELAVCYLKEQAEIMRKYGETPKLSGKRYEHALQSITRTLETLESAR